MSSEELLIEAVRRLAARADPSLIERLARGDVELAFVEVNPVAAAIADEPIDQAYATLKAMKASDINKYFNVPRPLDVPRKPDIPASAKPAEKLENLTQAILMREFGQHFEPPPAPPKRLKPRSATKLAEPFDVAIVVAKLKAAESEAEARAVLAAIGRDRPSNQAVARALDVEFAERDSVQKLHNAIYHQTVAPRLSNLTYMTPRASALPPRPKTHHPTVG